MTDKPLPMSEAIAHYAGRLSDPTKIARLRKAIELAIDYLGAMGLSNSPHAHFLQSTLLDTQDKL